jgi:hypothetical protein
LDEKKVTPLSKQSVNVMPVNTQESPTKTTFCIKTDVNVSDGHPLNSQSAYGAEVHSVERTTVIGRKRKHTQTRTAIAKIVTSASFVEWKIQKNIKQMKKNKNKKFTNFCIFFMKIFFFGKIESHAEKTSVNERKNLETITYFFLKRFLF